ncbi:MAG TPA: hypothetical protein VMV00_01915 [Candidatus Baltobacteraceae bacterium]|nr:hypothetical protein [Candidatus Baltobacteraceae bacterium]
MRHVKALVLALVILAVAISAYYVFFYIAFPPYSTLWGNYCTLSAGIKCLSSGIAANGLLTIMLEQSMYPQMDITAIGCNGLGSPDNLTVINPPTEAGLGQSVTLSVRCYGSNSTQFGGAAGNAYSGYLVMSYTTPSGVNITIPGLLNLKRG